MYETGFAAASIAFGLKLQFNSMVPMQVRLYQHPFHTLGVDYVGELPLSPSGNKWILTAVFLGPPPTIIGVKWSITLSR